MSHENHHLKDFTDFNDFENLKKELTCFKSTSSTTIDLFLINRKGCFIKQENQTITKSFTPFFTNTLHSQTLTKRIISLKKSF